jgi:hypothetical protein
MSAGDKYYTVPLSILRSGTSALDALNSCFSCGMLNAGIGFRKSKPDEFQSRLDALALEHRPRGVTLDQWEAAHVGAALLDITGGCRATDVKRYLDNNCAGQVFFRICHDWMWGAILSARREAGMEVKSEFKPLSWREFRILAAVLSGQVNNHGFSFLGWEIIQARACGFHSKKLFNAGKNALPPHCMPFTRDVIRRDVEKLEALGFFARCRYATGTRGGLMAYSFRHPKREELAAAVKLWSDANHSFKIKSAANRAADLEAFKKTK